MNQLILVLALNSRADHGPNTWGLRAGSAESYCWWPWVLYMSVSAGLKKRLWLLHWHESSLYHSSSGCPGWLRSKEPMLSPGLRVMLSRGPSRLAFFSSPGVLSSDKAASHQCDTSRTRGSCCWEHCGLSGMLKWILPSWNKLRGQLMGLGETCWGGSRRSCWRSCFQARLSGQIFQNPFAPTVSLHIPFKGCQSGSNGHAAHSQLLYLCIQHLRACKSCAEG